MKKFTTLFVALAILFTSTISSCIGSFSAFNNLKDWNQEVTDNKFVNELVFLALNIIPVYGLFLVGDMIVFNLIEFWTGDNPIAMKDGEVQKQNITFKGEVYEMTATKNKMTVANESGEIVSELIYDEETKTWLVADGENVQKVVTFTGVEGNLASYKVYNNDCNEGQIFTLNTQEVDFRKGVTAW